MAPKYPSAPPTYIEATKEYELQASGDIPEDPETETSEESELEDDANEENNTEDEDSDASDLRAGEVDPAPAEVIGSDTQLLIDAEDRIARLRRRARRRNIRHQKLFAAADRLITRLRRQLDAEMNTVIERDDEIAEADDRILALEENVIQLTQESNLARQQLAASQRREARFAARTAERQAAILKPRRSQRLAKAKK